MSMDNAGGKKTVVEEGTEFKGALTSTCPVEVRGRIDGELATPALTISNSGAVSGECKVGTMKSQGEISGRFEADTIELSGQVKDNTVIVAKTLDVKLSSDEKMQVTFGNCELSVGDDPKAARDGGGDGGDDGGASDDSKKGGSGGNGEGGDGVDG